MAKDAVATSTKKKRQIPGFSQMQRIGPLPHAPDRVPAGCRAAYAVRVC